MNESGTLDFLRHLLLFCDGIASVAAIERAYFYRKNRIFVFFLVLSIVYGVTTLSDLFVVANWPVWWARTPIIRGLVLRVPIAAVLLWMMITKHG